jgi:hypothetical protein
MLHKGGIPPDETAVKQRIETQPLDSIHFIMLP